MLNIKGMLDRGEKTLTEIQYEKNKKNPQKSPFKSYIQRRNDGTGRNRVLYRGGIQKEFGEGDVESLKVCKICKMEMKF